MDRNFNTNTHLDFGEKLSSIRVFQGFTDDEIISGKYRKLDTVLSIVLFQDYDKLKRIESAKTPDELTCSDLLIIKYYLEECRDAQFPGFMKSTIINLLCDINFTITFGKIFSDIVDSLGYTNEDLVNNYNLTIEDVFFLRTAITYNDISLDLLYKVLLICSNEPLKCFSNSNYTLLNNFKNDISNRIIESTEKEIEAKQLIK